jgi:4-hydroxy-3-methylbut-2-enyl diphosphate reductase
VEDVAALDLPNDEPMAYITQTTLSVDDTRDIIAALEIVSATRVRHPRHLLRDTKPPVFGARPQQARRRHSGGRRDQQLQLKPPPRNRDRSWGPSYLIADGSQLNPEWLKDATTVGITAGASAPEVLVDDVIDALRESDR